VDRSTRHRFRRGGATPVRDKRQLVEDLRAAVVAATAYCTSRGVSLAEIESQPSGSMARLQRLDDAVNALIAPDGERKTFLAHARLVGALCDAVKPDPSVTEFMARAGCLAAVAGAIRAKPNPDPASIPAVLTGVAQVLDASIAGVSITPGPAKLVNLSRIDFEALRDRFARSEHKQSDLEELKAAIRAQLDRMIQVNRSRTDYLEKFERLIESYNSGSRGIEQVLDELVSFAPELYQRKCSAVFEHIYERYDGASLSH
jgi:type I restriction enzyme R subunit